MSIGIAFKAFFRALGDAEFASRVSEILSGEVKQLEAGRQDSAAQLLAAMQREGRLVDFLQEDLSGFKDAQIGAVARDMHEGCRKVLGQYLEIVPIQTESEGQEVTVPEGFDAHQVRLVGKVEGEPPFKGTLRHHGWKLVSSKLPPLGDDLVLVPAEVELE